MEKQIVYLCPFHLKYSMPPPEDMELKPMTEESGCDECLAEYKATVSAEAKKKERPMVFYLPRGERRFRSSGGLVTKDSLDAQRIVADNVEVLIWCRNGEMTSVARPCESIKCRYKRGFYDIWNGIHQCGRYAVTLRHTHWETAAHLPEGFHLRVQ